MTLPWWVSPSSRHPIAARPEIDVTVMSKRLVLHLGFVVLAAALVARVIVEAVAADERRARANAEIAEWVAKWPEFAQTEVDDQARDEANRISADPANVASSLNCSKVEPFTVAKPARNGFVCSSEGRAAHPLTVFIYDPGVAPSASESRTRRACEKARAAGQPFVYVLSTETLFVYTTSAQAVEVSAVAGLFTTFDARRCG